MTADLLGKRLFSTQENNERFIVRYKFAKCRQR